MSLALVLLALTLLCLHCTLASDRLRLHSTLASDRLCQTSRIQLAKINARCIQLLEEMNGMSPYFPARCFPANQRRRVEFYPERLYDNNTSDSLVSITIETIQAVSEGFHGNMSTLPSSWRRDTVSLFRNLLTRQERNLSPCVTTAGKMNPGLKLYSDRLNSFLTQQGHSVCAWETVRAEARHVLEELITLLNTTRN